MITTETALNFMKMMNLDDTMDKQQKAIIGIFI